MAENAPFLNQNSSRFYPFENTKKLLLLDIILKVPTEIFGCFVSGVTAEYIIFSLVLLGGETKEYAKAENRRGIVNISLIHIQNADPIGVVTTGETFSYPLEFAYLDTKLLDSVLVREPLGHVRNVYIKKKNNEIVKINPNFIIRQGKNVLIDTEQSADTITISALSINQINNYIRRLVITDPNNIDSPLTIKGDSLSVHGSNIVHISADIFSTRVLNSELMCPTVFVASSKGIKGDAGPEGLSGLQGSGDIIDCGTKEFCDPCAPECGEFDSICEPPEFPEMEYPPFPDIPDTEDLGCPVDVDFPEPEEEEEEEGGGIDCDVFPLETLDDYNLLDIGTVVDPDTPGTPGKFAKGIFSSGYPDALAGPMTEDYAYLIISEGLFCDDTAQAPYDLPPGHEYIVEFSNIEFQDVPGGGIEQKSLYFHNGFRTALSGSMAFNAPASYSNNVFMYCTDELCQRVFIYETIKEDFSGEWDHGHYGSTTNTSKDAAKIQARNKNLYAVWEDGTKKKIINVNSEKSEFLGNIPMVTIYDVTDRDRYPELPLLCSIFFEEDVEKISTTDSGPSDPEIAKLIYSVCHPLSPLGLSCISNISVNRTPTRFFRSTDYSASNITGCFAWNTGGATKETYYCPYNRRRSWYKNMNMGSSSVKVYKNLLTVAKATYFDDIAEIVNSPILEIIDQGMGKPPVIKTQPTLYKYYNYYGADRISDAIGIFAFTKEIIYNTDSNPVVLDRIHMLAVTNNNISAAAFPPGSYEFELYWSNWDDIRWRTIGNGQSTLYDDREKLGEIYLRRIDIGFVWGRSIVQKNYYENENNFILRFFNADGTETIEETLMTPGFHALMQDQQGQPYPDLWLHWASWYDYQYAFACRYRVPGAGDNLDDFWVPNPPCVKEQVLVDLTLRVEVEMLSPSLITPMPMEPEVHPAIFSKSSDIEFSTMLHWIVYITYDWDGSRDSIVHGTTELKGVWFWRYTGDTQGTKTNMELPAIPAEGYHGGHPAVSVAAGGIFMEGWTNKPYWHYSYTSLQVLWWNPALNDGDGGYEYIWVDVPAPPGGCQRWSLDCNRFSSPDIETDGRLVFLGPSTMLNPEGGIYTLYRRLTYWDAGSGTIKWKWMEYPAYTLTVSNSRQPATGLDYVRFRGHHKDKSFGGGWPTYADERIEGFYMSDTEGATTYALEGEILEGTIIGDPTRAYYSWSSIGRGRFENGYKFLPYPDYEKGGFLEYRFKRADLIILSGGPLDPGLTYAFQPDIYVEITIGSDAKEYERRADFVTFENAGHMLDCVPIW